MEIRRPNTLQTVQRVIPLNPNRHLLASVGRPRDRRLVLRDLLLQSKEPAKSLARHALSLLAQTLCRLQPVKPPSHLHPDFTRRLRPLFNHLQRAKRLVHPRLDFISHLQLLSRLRHFLGQLNESI